MRRVIGTTLARRPLHGSSHMPEEWTQKVVKELKREPQIRNRHGVDVKPIYTTEDIEFLDKTELPAKFPYTRGPYASMYTGRPWTIRQVQEKQRNLSFFFFL